MKSETPGSTLTWRPSRGSCSGARYMNGGVAVGHWLTSEAFDLATDRGSIEAEQVVLRARELLSGDEPSLEEVEAVGRELIKVLSDSDPFLAGWGHFRESLKKKRATG